MAADLFDFTAERLEHHTSLDRLEARGTLRIALKAAGLKAKSVSAAQLCVVFEKLMPDELDAGTNPADPSSKPAARAAIEQRSRLR